MWRRVVDRSSWSTRGTARADLLCLNSCVKCSLDYRLYLIPLRALQESAIESCLLTSIRTLPRELQTQGQETRHQD